MALTTYEIQKEARYIRDHLCPLVNESGGTAITPDILSSLLEFFAKLETMPISVDLLRQTRIDKALIEVSVLATRWPASVVCRAETMLRAWENEVGQVGQLRAALWEPGGRMAGCHKFPVIEQRAAVDRKGKITKAAQKPRKHYWVVDAMKPAKANDYGDVNLEVGSWWIEAACACRDGMLDDPNSDIAMGDYGACAIVFARGSEIDNMDGTSTWTCNRAEVKSGRKGPGVLGLMKNMREHTDVRVLRSWKLKSKLSPRGGVRYDGLYSVVGYGLKRVGDTLQYTFRLRRREDQIGLERALTHPTADEYDDWVDYRKTQKERKVVMTTVGADRRPLPRTNKEMDGTSEDHSMEDEDDWVTSDGESEHSMGVNNDEGLAYGTGNSNGGSSCHTSDLIEISESSVEFEPDDEGST